LRQKVESLVINEKYEQATVLTNDAIKRSDSNMFIISSYYALRAYIFFMMQDYENAIIDLTIAIQKQDQKK
jgi:hypothetical protein